MPSYQRVPPTLFNNVPVYYYTYAPSPTTSRGYHAGPSSWWYRPPPASYAAPVPASPAGPPEAPRPRVIPLPELDGHHRPRHAPDVPWRSASSASSDDSRPASPGRLIIDPLLAVPQHPTARPPLTWDLMHPPTSALVDSPTIKPAELKRRAVRTSGGNRAGSPQLIVLIFPYLSMEIEVRPSRSRSSSRESGEPFITVADVLEGLYRGLRAPIEPHELLRMSQSEQSALSRAAQRRLLAIPEDAQSRHAQRMVDYIWGRRRFQGIRPASRSELPRGRKLDEVFVVEVGSTGDR